MILTVTMNPSVDMSYPLPHFKLDDVNRVSEVSKTAGGKGLNVSRVLHQLDQELLATGVLGGYLGAYIEAELEKEGIPHAFTKIKEESRNSIAILHDQGKQTELLEKGPTVTRQEEQAFIEHFKALVKESSLVTISGSLAAGLSPNLYELLTGLASEVKVPVLLDTSGNALKQAVLSENKPFLIKPNETEIAELLSAEEGADEELLEQLKHPMFDGIDWIVVSLGAAGAIAKHKEKIYQVEIPALDVVNPVGSGDATLAGLAGAAAERKTDEDILKWGMTAGMLNALEAKTGWINPERIADYFDQIVVTML